MTDKTRINIWVSAEQKTLWDESAGTLGISLTDFIKRAVHQLLKASAATVDIAPLLAKMDEMNRKLDTRLEQKAALDGIALLVGNFEEDTVLSLLKAADLSLAKMAQLTSVPIAKLLVAAQKLEKAGKIEKNAKNEWRLLP